MSFINKTKLTKEEKELKNIISDIVDVSEKLFYRSHTILKGRDERKFKARMISEYEAIKKIPIRDIDPCSKKEKFSLLSFATSSSIMGGSIPFPMMVSQLQRKVKINIISPDDLRKEINILKYSFYSEHASKITSNTDDGGKMNEMLQDNKW